LAIQPDRGTGTNLLVFSGELDHRGYPGAGFRYAGEIHLRCGICNLFVDQFQKSVQCQQLVVDIMPCNPGEEVQFPARETERFFRTFSCRDIPDIALDDLVFIHQVGIADELDIHTLSAFCLKREIFVPDIPFCLQFGKCSLGHGFVPDESQFPKVFPDKILLRVSHHIDDKFVGIDNSTGLPVKYQDCILCSFKEAAVLEFALDKCLFDLPSRDCHLDLMHQIGIQRLCRPGSAFIEIEIRTVLKGFDGDCFPAPSGEHDERDIGVRCPDLF